MDFHYKFNGYLHSYFCGEICQDDVVSQRGSAMRNKFFTQIFQNSIRKVLRHPKYRWFAIVAGLFYLISPLDISPDVVPILGWIDDGLIASLVVAEASQIVMEQLKNRKKVTNAESNSTQIAATIDVKPVSL